MIHYDYSIYIMYCVLSCSIVSSILSFIMWVQNGRHIRRSYTADDLASDIIIFRPIRRITFGTIEQESIPHV